MSHVVDLGLIGALHVHQVGLQEAPERLHEAFQTSTLGALLDARYDGDVAIGELHRHGDFGLGTFDALDGELVMLDGEVWRAGADGDLNRPADDVGTPFAVVTRFDADVEVTLDAPIDHEALVALIERHVAEHGCAAVRFDGRLEQVHARSVPRQLPPYRPLAEVAAEQHVFDITASDGSLVGFRFPAETGTINLPGYHLHVATADRTRGGHVLRARVGPGTLALDHLDDLHMELPPGIELPTGPADLDALDRAERQG
jgi:acetolactate decarboxylase